MNNGALGNLQFYLNERGPGWELEGRVSGLGVGANQTTDGTREKRKMREEGNRLQRFQSALKKKQKPNQPNKNKQTKPNPTNLRNREKFKSSVHLCLGVSGHAGRKPGKLRLQETLREISFLGKRVECPGALES